MADYVSLIFQTFFNQGEFSSLHNLSMLNTHFKKIAKSFNLPNRIKVFLEQADLNEVFRPSHIPNTLKDACDLFIKQFGSRSASYLTYPHQDPTVNIKQTEQIRYVLAEYPKLLRRLEDIKNACLNNEIDVATYDRTMSAFQSEIAPHRAVVKSSGYSALIFFLTHAYWSEALLIFEVCSYWIWHEPEAIEALEEAKHFIESYQEDTNNAMDLQRLPLNK